MKINIAISLLTSTIFITTNHAATLDAARFKDRAGATSAVRVTPSTLNELECFLRKNCGTTFPEAGFRTFCVPFTPDFSDLRKINQAKAQTSAIENLLGMVALAQFAFTQELERKKAPILLSTEGHYVKDTAANRPAMMEHYRREHHPHFLKFQEMITRVLTWAQAKDSLSQDAKAALETSCGSSDKLEIAWLRDKTGIVPFAFDRSLKKITYSAFTPYGDWGDDYQRTLVFINGRLTTAPGIYIEPTAGGSMCKFVRLEGENGKFVTAPITMRVGWEHPIALELLSFGVLTKNQNAFLTLPETPDENKEFEAAFLEELMEEAQKSDAPDFCRHFLDLQARAIENIDKEGRVVEIPDGSDTVGTDIAPHTHPLRKYVDSLYEEPALEEQDLSEQAKTSRPVVESSTKGTPEASKKKSKPAPANPTNAATTTDKTSETDEKAAMRMKVLSNLKEQGRVKWRTLAKTLIAALNNAYADKSISIKATEKGSHVMLHIAGETESCGKTLVRPHGKPDRTISAGEARGLAESLFDLTSRLMAQKETR